jgi:hypothetical protein
MGIRSREEPTFSTATWDERVRERVRPYEEHDSDSEDEEDDVVGPTVESLPAMALAGMRHVDKDIADGKGRLSFQEQKNAEANLEARLGLVPTTTLFHLHRLFARTHTHHSFVLTLCSHNITATPLSPPPNSLLALSPST